MNVYIYSADLYCEQCGEAIRKDIYNGCLWGGTAPANPEDEQSYDSDDFPKGPYPNGGGEADYPQHCGAGSFCENAIDLPNGTRVGAWLENELTADGVEYVRQTDKCGEVAKLWADFYSDYYDLTD